MDKHEKEYIYQNDPGYIKLLKEYEFYKNGFEKKVKFPSALKGRTFFLQRYKFINIILKTLTRRLSFIT